MPCPEVMPAQELIVTAVAIASRSEAFVQSVREVIEAKLKTLPSGHPDFEEIKKLEVYSVDLMWPDQPKDGEIELRTSPESIRMWHCGYTNGKPVLPLAFSGLDN